MRSLFDNLILLSDYFDVFSINLGQSLIVPSPHRILVQMHVITIDVSGSIINICQQPLFARLQIGVFVASVTGPQDSLADQFVRDRFQFSCPAQPGKEIKKTRREVEVVCSKFGCLIVPREHVLLEDKNFHSLCMLTSSRIAYMKIVESFAKCQKSDKTTVGRTDISETKHISKPVHI